MSRPSLHYLRWLLGLSQPITQTTAAERDTLARHATGRRRLVEIGVFHGVTTRRLRETMAADGLLWAVDPFPPNRFGFSYAERIAHATAGGCERGDCRWIRDTGAAAAQMYATQESQPVDFIFVDGDHSWEGIRADWEGWSPLVAPQGIVALHDSRSTPERNIEDAGSVRYTNSVIRVDPRFLVIETVDSLTVLQRQ